MAEQPEEQQAYTQWIYRNYGQILSIAATSKLLLNFILNIFN